MSGTTSVFVNGRFLGADEAHLSALDRGFTLGDGVFETMRAYGGHVFRLQDHLARLRFSAKRLALPVPWSDVQLSEALGETMARNGLADAILRLTVSRGVPTRRGLEPPLDPKPTLVIQAVPAAAPSMEKYQGGYSAVLASIRRNESSPLSYVKSCNYLDSVLVKMEALAAGADEGIMLNTAGNIACGSSSNIFLVLGDRLVTPSLDCGVLAGITRRVVLELAADLGLGREERPVALEELSRCQEAFLTNSVIEVMPLTKWQGKPIGGGRPGPTTRRIAAAYGSLVESAEG